MAVVSTRTPGKDLGFLRQPGHGFFYASGGGRALAESRQHTPTRGTRVKPQPATDPGRLYRKHLPAATTASAWRLRGAWPGARCRRAYGSWISGSAASISTYALMDATGLTISWTPARAAESRVRCIVDRARSSRGTEGRNAPALKHTCDEPDVVLRMAVDGRDAGRMLLVGCEPANLGGEEGKIGLSEPVRSGRGARRRR